MTGSDEAVTRSDEAVDTMTQTLPDPRDPVVPYLRYGDWRHSYVGFEGPSTF